MILIDYLTFFSHSYRQWMIMRCESDESDDIWAACQTGVGVNISRPLVRGEVQGPDHITTFA